MIIDENITSELIISKSRFITYLYKVKSKEEIENYLTNLKKEYKDATHICYAYILDNEEKYDDNKEPQGTAGLPILEVLKKNNLNYIVCFVIRYFGGIKLGSGGLIRAYSNCCSQALKETNLIKLEKKYKIKLTTDYKNNKTILTLINDKNILEKDFQEDITYTLLINQELKDKFDLMNMAYTIIEETYF